MASDDMPADPMPSLNGGWIVIYEMYKSARAAGFSFIEAAVMVAAIVAIRKPEAPS